MRRVFGVLVLLVGALLLLGSVMLIVNAPGEPVPVTLQEIEEGRRPEAADGWWAVSGAVAEHDKSFSTDAFVYVPYATSASATWDEIVLVARFSKRDFTDAQIRAHGNPTGSVRSAKASGTLPDEMLAMSDGLDQRAVVIYPGNDPSHPAFGLITGLLVSLLGWRLFRRRSDA